MTVGLSKDLSLTNQSGVAVKLKNHGIRDADYFSLAIIKMYIKSQLRIRLPLRKKHDILA